MRAGSFLLKVKSEKYNASLIHTGPSYKPGLERVGFAEVTRVATNSPLGASPVQAAKGLVIIAGTDVIPSVVSPDGMVVDCQGNIYVAENNLQRVHVYTNKGESLAIIKTDANTTNAAFGGESGKTLYITGLDAIWKVDLNITGSPY